MLKQKAFYLGKTTSTRLLNSYYKVVSVLKNPNFSKWNPQAQMFISKVENDLQNNIRLLDFLSPFEKLLAEQEFENGKELFATYEADERERAEQAIIAAKKELTLGEFLENVIEELRNPEKRKPSANFMTYQSLQNKLKKEVEKPRAIAPLRQSAIDP